MLNSPSNNSHLQTIPAKIRREFKNLCTITRSLSERRMATQPRQLPALPNSINPKFSKQGHQIQQLLAKSGLSPKNKNVGKGGFSQPLMNMQHILRNYKNHRPGNLSLTRLQNSISKQLDKKQEQSLDIGTQFDTNYLLMSQDDIANNNQSLQHDSSIQQQQKLLGKEILLQQQQSIQNTQNQSTTFTRSIDQFKSFSVNFDQLGQENSKRLLELTCEPGEINNRIESMIKQEQVNQFLSAQEKRQEQINSLMEQFVIPEVKRWCQMGNGKADGVLDILKIIYEEQIVCVTQYCQLVVKLDQKNSKIINDQKDDQNENAKLNKEMNDAWRMLLLMRARYENVEEKEKNEQLFKGSYQEHKRNLQFESENPKIKQQFQILRQSEQLFEELQNKILQQNEHIQNLQSTINNLQKFIKDSVVLSECETETLLRKYEQECQKDPPVVKTIDNLVFIEQLCRDIIDIYKEKIEGLEKQVANMKGQQNVQNDRRRNSRKLEKQIEKMHRIMNKPKLDKEVQVNLALKENVQTPLSQPLTISTILPTIQSELLSYNKNTVKLSYDASLCLISLIINDKLLSDYECFKQGMNCKNLQNYLKEWFLVQFNNETLAEMLLLQFLCTLKDSESRHNRISIFLQLCGFRNQKEYLLIAKGVQPINLDFKAKYYQSFQACRAFVKLAFLLKYISIELEDQYKPFLSYPTNPNDEFIYAPEIALEACRIIIMEENMDPGCVYEFIKVFEQAVVDDYNQRVVERQNDEAFERANQQQQDKNNNNNNIKKEAVGRKKKVDMEFGIRFDNVAKCLLDYLSDEKTKKFSQIATSLKVMLSNRKLQDFSYKEWLQLMKNSFQDKVTELWILRRFTEFIERNQYKTVNINVLMNNILQEFLEVGFSGIQRQDQFYLKFKQNAYFQVINNLPFPNQQTKQKNQQQKEQKKQQFNFLLAEEYEQCSEIPVSVLSKKMFDVIGNMILVEEIYFQSSKLIKFGETKSEQVRQINSNLKLELQKLPRKPSMSKQFENLLISTFSREELIKKIRNAQGLFKEVIDIVVSKIGVEL